MTQSTVSCDVCGTVKKESNHWYAIRDGSSTKLRFVGIAIQPFKDDAPGGKDVCSEKCAIVLISQWMEQQRKLSCGASVSQ
jgi:hypothetical protein